MSAPTETDRESLTEGQWAWLEYVDGGERSGFDCMFSTRTHRKDVAESLVELCLLSHLDAVQCDGDGGLIGGVENYATGYALTGSGHDAVVARAAKGVS